MLTVRLTSALGSERDVNFGDNEFINYVSKKKIKADTLFYHPKHTNGTWVTACNVAAWETFKAKPHAILTAAKEEKQAARELKKATKLAATKNVSQPATEILPPAAPTPAMPAHAPVSNYQAPVAPASPAVTTNTQINISNESNHWCIVGFINSSHGLLS